ncbi:DnaJ domain protein [Necator americanus]|uniref:DnaJ domain protein n=1 Tax=Necator americanus TaxID=51031 RepID=W2TLN3_NECAM|nr:DnaJ domain protein [Necator americanus]ETN81937.1 DnaJ domain protein [Necator americanus]
MAVTYGRHHMTIGPFEDSRHFVSMLVKCTNAAERDHYILLISKLALNKDNVRELINSQLLPILVDLAALAHLHSNVIEASSEQISEGSSAEWYYASHDNNKDKIGPLSFEKMKTLYADKTIFEKTAVWAAGMEKWEPLSKVPQFRWTVCLGQQGGVPLYNFTQLCSLCLDIMIQMCEFFPSRDENNSIVRPMPQVKKNLTEPVLLYQIVQLLLTYDPSIVQRVATLVHLVMQDNPFLPRLYLSGVFFFILMYNGSNVLPIARFLHYTHKKQAFRSALPGLEGASHSVLSPLLPAAAIFYLEEYGPDKYAEVFLGEFDNPEIIWSTQMRRHLIERIAVHVSDFSNRLTSNVKALYQYCPIPLIDYPELQNELFCYVYYLRHLCDRQRFPDWVIRDPIPFLRACLSAWFEELEKKPPVMSIEQARETLGLNTMEEGWQDPAVIRRAYFKLAARYHPDKNPEGREMFEKINTAYELLSSDAELSEYKYAGYGQLIRTIDLEAKNSSLFQEGGGALLRAAVELANYTLMSSALNAEQLRREQGLEALQTAFDRCVPVITESSLPTDMAVQVCEHICNCFATASSFEACCQRIAEMPSLFGNICRLLQFQDLPRLSAAAAQCICSMAVDTLLQTQLFQSGVLWQLVPHLFHYDYTLDEGGVSHSEESNKQALANRLARISCEALACLAGFREGTPENDGVQNSLRALLTSYVCRCMRTESNDAVLKTLNSNTENPYLIWDNGTRAELLEFVERHRTSREQTSELFGAEFQLSIHAKELVVGDIFVRIYNEQPTFPLLEPKKVAMDLLDYMGRYAGELTGQLKKPTNGNLIDIDWSSSNANKMSADEKVTMCAEALANLVSANPGVEILLIGHFHLIVAYLRARLYPKIQMATLKVSRLPSAVPKSTYPLCKEAVMILRLLIQKTGP